MKASVKLLIFIIVSGLFYCRPATAKTGDKKPGDDNDVSTEVVSHDKSSLFSETASYTFSVKNGTDDVQAGSVSYLVTDEKGVRITDKKINIKIKKKSTASYDFDIPNLKTGFYKINFMVNVSDYDDTTRKAFGIRAEQIRSEYGRPADFDQFWQTAKNELAKVKPEFKVTERPDLNKDNRRVYAIEMKSLDNMTIRGWLTIPVSSNKNKKFSVLVGLPGYQVNLQPLMGVDNDLAIITLNVRGQGNSRDVIHTRREEYIYYHVEDKNKYVMRGVIMDCIRCIDFIYSRPDLDHDHILVSGGSMGGYLCLATAGLDSRITICSAQNPILADVSNLPGEVEWPMNDIQTYAKILPGIKLSQILDNLAYYDCKNFATTIKCPVIMGIGLVDPYAPPNCEFAAFNNIPGKKKIMAFDLGHEVSLRYMEYEGKWMRDTFGLF